MTSTWAFALGLGIGSVAGLCIGWVYGVLRGIRETKKVLEKQRWAAK